MILPVSAVRYEVQDRELFLMPVPLGNEPPAIPEGLGQRDLAPVTVCAEIVVDDDGKVVQATPLFDGDCGRGEPAVVAELQQAALARLAQWRFDPAAVCTFATAQAARNANGTCKEGGTERRNVAVRLAYAFTFEVRNGQGRVVGNRADGK